MRLKGKRKRPCMYRVDNIYGEHLIGIQAGKTRTSILLNEENVDNAVYNHADNKHNITFPNYALNISFNEVSNTYEVSTLDLDDSVHAFRSTLDNPGCSALTYGTPLQRAS